MLTNPTYSTLFTCLYDESDPVGQLGRGTHYSVFRSVEWLNVVRTPLIEAEIHDFAVIWDEDHDVRIIPVIDSLYINGFLSPIQFIGERKGTLTILLAAKFYWHGTKSETESYINRVKAIVDQSQMEDKWPVEIGIFDRAPCWPAHQTETQGLILDSEYRVVTYLRNIDSLWTLGTKPYPRPATSPSFMPPVPAASGPGLGDPSSRRLHRR